MTVSLCVIAYNEEKTLPQLLQNICDQTYPRELMEIVLVDASSADRTKVIMFEFAASDHGFMQVQVLDNLKRIQAAGWNVAIRAAKGDIIIRVDAHAEIPDNFVMENVKCMESGEFVTGGRRPNTVSEKTLWQHTLLLAESSVFGSGVAIFRRSEKETYVKSVFHGAYRKEVFEKIGGFNENLGRTEDNEIHYRIRKAGYKIYYSPKIISYQHIRAGWGKLIRQKYQNGYWIGLTTGICPACLSAYHFAPMVFMLGVILTVVLLIGGIDWPFIVIAAGYTVMNILLSISAVLNQKKNVSLFMLPLIFLSMHAAYGIGSIIGILKMPFWRRNIK